MLALLVSLLVTTFPTGGPATAAASTDPIDVPMTGNLPACPAQMTGAVRADAVWVHNDLNNQFRTDAWLGLANNCAMQNDQDDDDTSSYPRAVDAKAVPSEISISSEPITVSVQATPAFMPGPYNTFFPDCLPRSARPGGCADSPHGYRVAYRVANGAGQFVGKWTLAGLDGPDPYFDLTRGSCPDQYPGWTENYEHIGVPCVFTLRFVTNALGAPVLTTGMQVVLSVSLASGTRTHEPFVGPVHDTTAVVPMLFQPGASSRLGFSVSSGSVRSGETVILTALAQGPQPGTPVNFYRRRPGGDWTYLGQRLTRSNNRAAFTATVATTATYRARLASGGVETTTSPLRQVEALRSVSLRLRHLRGARYRFTGTVSPAAQVGRVVLQQRTRQGWQRVTSAAPRNGRVTWVRTLPARRTWWRLLTATTVSYGQSTSPVRTVDP